MIRKLFYKIIQDLVVFNLKKEDFSNNENLLNNFIELANNLNLPRVLELGTKRSIINRSTLHKDWIPNSSEYHGTDIDFGEDVDFIADIHNLSQVTGNESYDIVISCSTFEHFKYPHKAAHEIMKTLKIGGLLFIQTHQTFPIHAYPFDYFRFSREALASLFGTEMGFQVISTDYEFPAKIISSEHNIMQKLPAFLNVRLLGKKIEKTPEVIIYEL